MSKSTSTRSVLRRTTDPELPGRITRTVQAREEGIVDLAEFDRWFARRRDDDSSRVRRIPFDALEGWHFRPGDGNLVHESGKFFTVEGLRIRRPGGPVPAWSQPIIKQSEIGILGILVKDFGGVLHCLMQAKMEPGNSNGIQLSPTVQATRSNYTRVHGGAAVPYLDYFRHADRHRVLADALQSEQGSWFYRKRNRNMIIEVTDEVEQLDGFVWLTIGQLQELLAVPNLVNMDTRTVLSCLPVSGQHLCAALGPPDHSLAAALLRSFSAKQGAMYSGPEILSWITAARALNEIETDRIGLAAVDRWHCGSSSISHDTGLFFDVIAVETFAQQREVRRWTQPMIAPCGTGVVAFLAKVIAGVLHLLVNVRVEPGYLDVVELAPTVQCDPENYAHSPASARPTFLDLVLDPPPENLIFDTMHSEEGGRFFHAEARYMVVLVDEPAELEVPPDFRWMTGHQLTALIRHSHYVNVQARSLVACLVGCAAGRTHRGRDITPVARPHA